VVVSWFILFNLNCISTTKSILVAPSAHMAPFSSRELFKGRALGWNHCFVVMASDRNNPGTSSVDRLYLPVIGATPSLREKKGSKRYRIELASSALAEKAFERCQRRLNSFESTHPWFRLLDYMESQYETLQLKFVGLPSLSPHFQ